MATRTGNAAPTPGIPAQSDIVEINLLLPAQRMEALMALSRERRESVGQLLRQWIDQGLGIRDSIPA